MIDNVSSLGGGVWNSASKTSKDSPEKIKGAAQQFEAMMIQQLLKTSRTEGSGWLGTDGEDPGQNTLDMAEQQLSLMMSKNGGLGLTKTIVDGISKNTTSPPSER